MTLEQLTSPMVLDYIFGYDDRINEGLSTTEDYMGDFSEWFKKNEDKINESLKNKNLIKESKDEDDDLFDELFDDDEDDEPEKKSSEDDVDDLFDDEEDSDSKPESTPESDDEPDDILDDDESEPSPEPDDEDPDDDVDDLLDDKSKTKTRSEKVFIENNKEMVKAVNHIYDIIDRNGYNMKRITPLSNLDTSRVTDMTALLAFTNIPNVDLSGWDTKRVALMEGMFYKSTFNNDSICEWKVYNCADFKNMFLGSKFNQSLSKWRPKKIKTIKRVKNDDGDWETTEIMAPAPLPIIGANEDEEREMEAAFWNTKFADFNYESKLSNLMDFDTFVLNEGLKDKFGKVKNIISKGIDKVKNFIKGMTVKLNDYFVTFFDDKGKVLPVMSPYTALNYISAGNVPGVTVYSTVKNEYVNKDVSTSNSYDGLDDTGYYPAEFSERERENYKTFMEFLNESYKVDENSENLNEGRVGMAAEYGGISIEDDIDSKSLKEILKAHILTGNPSDNKDYASNPLLIWGAPGIGKTTIPKAVIEAFNEEDKRTDPKHKKSVFVVECGDLTTDGFAIPVPNKKNLSKILSGRPDMAEYAKKLGLSEEDIAEMYVVSSEDIPKFWIPCYPLTNTPEAKILRELANGQVVKTRDSEGNDILEERCDGGILMFDEFLRADQNVFKILMQIFNTRMIQQRFKIGDKWSIIACSNRPNDDVEVEMNRDRLGGAAGSRFAAQYNFVPNFPDWKKWAEKSGLFNEATLAFLTSDEEGGEYINWHYTSNNEGDTIHANPRSWTNLMISLRNLYGKNWINTADFGEQKFVATVKGAVGKIIGKKYINWLLDRGGEVSFSPSEVFSNPDYETPKPISAAEATESLTNYIESGYDKDELPSPEFMMNMFDFLNKNYRETQDNLVKQLHVICIRRINRMPKDKRVEYKKYISSCMKRYGVTKEDIKVIEG